MSENSVIYDNDDTPKKCNKNCYEKHILTKIKFLYIIAIIVWLLLIYFLDIIPTGWLGWLILLVPIVVFSISLFSVKYLTKDVEKEMFQGNFFSFAYLIALIIINWSSGCNKTKLYKLFLASTIFLLLSMVDSWIYSKYIILMKHFRTVCQTFAVVLLVYSVYLYYTENVANCKMESKEPFGILDKK